MTCYFDEREREGMCHMDILNEFTIDKMYHRYQEQFDQCSTILLKVAEKVTADTLERAMARLATETARFDVAATVEWGGALCSVVGAAAGTGQPSTVDGWLWAAVGLLLTAVLVQTGYVNRAVVERALRSARDYIRRCRRDRSPLPPTRPPPTRLPPLALGSCLPPPFIQFSTLDPPTSPRSLPSVEDESTPPPTSRRPRTEFSTPPLSPDPSCTV